MLHRSSKNVHALPSFGLSIRLTLVMKEHSMQNPFLRVHNYIKYHVLSAMTCPNLSIYDHSRMLHEFLRKLLAMHHISFFSN